MNYNYGRNPLVLYADDNAFERTNFARLANDIDPSIKVKSFENSPQLAEYLLSMKDKSILPDLIVLDLYMPLWNGLETYRAIRADKTFRKIPISMLTASNDPDDLRAIKEHDLHHCLVKPLNVSSMRLLLSQVIATHNKLFKKLGESSRLDANEIFSCLSVARK